MARKNKKGTPYLGLELEPNEEKAIKKHLKDSDISAKQWLRYLIRKELKVLSLSSVEPKSIYQS